MLKENFIAAMREIDSGHFLFGLITLAVLGNAFWIKYVQTTDPCDSEIALRVVARTLVKYADNPDAVDIPPVGDDLKVYDAREVRYHVGSGVRECVGKFRDVNGTEYIVPWSIGYGWKGEKAVVYFFGIR